MRERLRASVAARAGRGAGLENPGLVLDRYLGDAGTPDERNRLLRSVAEAGVAPGYQLRYQRWRAVLARLPHTKLGIFGTAGRLVVGLGNESVHETALVLQHLDGAPFLPGSALKGLAGHYLAQHVSSGGVDLDSLRRHQSILFGNTLSAGYISFFDAWYVPGTAPDDRPLLLDTITVHHPGYYTTQGRQEPWDLDDPNPVPFLSVRGSFLVAARGPDDPWSAFAFSLLRQALSDWGVGAKTSSGYGRLEWLEDVAPAVRSGIPEQRERTATADHPLVRTLQAIPPARIRQEIGGIVQQAERLDEPDRGQVLRAVAAVLHASEALWRWAQGRPWFQIVAAPATDPEGEDKP